MNYQGPCYCCVCAASTCCRRGAGCLALMGFLTVCTETVGHCFLPALRTPADSSRPSAINLVGRLGGFLDYGDLKIKIPFVLIRSSGNVSLLLLGIFAKLRRSVGKATAFGMSCNFHVLLGKEDILRWSV